jgi:hypothetical protein
MFDHHIPSDQADADLKLEEQLELFSTMDVSQVAATGSSEAAFGAVILGHPDAPPTIIGSCEPFPSPPLSAMRMRLPSSWSKVRAFLAEPEPTKENDNICTDSDDGPEARRWVMLAHVGFDLRCGAGQRFARDRVAFNAAYKSSSTAQKAVFRKQWAKKVYESICSVKQNAEVKSEASSHIDGSKGTYMPFACIVPEEGNDSAGMTAAINYVEAYQEMVGVWKKKNQMKKPEEFLYMRQEMREMFEQSCKVFEEHMLGAGHQTPAGPAPGNGGSAVTGSTEAAVKTVGNQKENSDKSRAMDAVSGSTQAVAGQDDASHPTWPRLSSDWKRNLFDIALEDALDFCTMYRWVTSKIELVMKQIQSNKDWKWARDYYKGEIMKIGDPIKELTATAFARLFLSQELQDINQTYCKNDLLIHTMQFCKDFDCVLRRANKLVNKLTKMQSDSMK